MKRAFKILLRDPLSILGLVLVALVLICAVFADVIAPFPSHAYGAIDFANANKPPQWPNILGTDVMGRDILTRLIFAYRLAVRISLTILVISVPVGVTLGLMAGYMGKKVSFVIMRITDIFLSVPPLVLAMAIMGLMAATLTNGLLAITVVWWPWYTRMIYNIVRAEREEGYVLGAEVLGASKLHVMFFEILPNCVPALITKLTLDVGFVILTTSSLAFLGLGVQPPTPDLGSMVSDGAKYLPDSWWLVLFPALAILIAVFGFSLLGDALRDILEVEE